MLVCLHPFLGYEEVPSPRKELNKATNLLADGWDLQSATKKGDWVRSV
jgi:hypothetical protein